MKTVVLALLLLIVAVAPAVAEPIQDIQTGLVAEGYLATPQGVVTAVRDNGFYLADGNYGAWDGIWIWTDGPHGMLVGDEVAICGVYEEYRNPGLPMPFDGLSYVNIPAAGWYGSVLKVGTLPVPPPTVVSAADLMADWEAYESCVILIPDGLFIEEGPGGGPPVDANGEWAVTSLGGIGLVFDDFWIDASSVDAMWCYNNAMGIWHQGPGHPGPGSSGFKLEPFVAGIVPEDCAVDTEELAFGAVKALYR